MSPKKKTKLAVRFSNARNQTRSRLLGLPAELRNHIYHLVLSEMITYISKDTVIKTPAVTYKSRPVHGFCFDQTPGVLLTCKQIHVEAIKVYYANADFVFTAASHLERWARKARPENKKCIQKARVHVMYDAMRSWAVVFAEVDCLRRSAQLPTLSYGYNSQGVWRLDKCRNFKFCRR
ncbi:Hypothetical predicted protein [Lecanosticta acicola]|uniref:Uncharacterized protein n=1 Tax=Lecanosticta acicola TaxID=111012 RepID=A0AAI9E948_9PEZI|nr:Hypothetical predicted protein [Lecanosticta acicola]